jgi:hypothetical protein
MCSTNGNYIGVDGPIHLDFTIQQLLTSYTPVINKVSTSHPKELKLHSIPGHGLVGITLLDHLPLLPEVTLKHQVETGRRVILATL